MLNVYVHGQVCWQVARWCRETGRPYLNLSPEGELLEELPRTVKLRC